MSWAIILKTFNHQYGKGTNQSTDAGLGPEDPAKPGFTL